MDKSHDQSSPVSGTLSSLSQPQSPPPPQDGYNLAHSFYDDTKPQTPVNSPPSVQEKPQPLVPEVNASVSPPEAPPALKVPTLHPFGPPAFSTPSSPSVAPSQPPPPPPLPPPSIEGGGSWIKFVKIGGGIVALLLLIFLIWKVVLPLFAQKAPEEVTLTYWGLWEEPRVMQTLFDDFSRKYPHIQVKYTRQDIKEYRQRLTTRVPLGNGPDLFRYHNTWYPMLTGILAPFPKGTIDTVAFQKNYYPVIQSDTVKNGAIYGIPLGIDTLTLFVNTDILTAAGQSIPTTWDEFIKVAKAVTVKDQTGKIQTSGAALGTYDNITHAPDIIALIMMQNGANLTALSQTADKAAEALTFYSSFAKDTNNVWDTTMDSSLDQFAKGSLAMYFGYSWDVFTLKAMNPELPFTTHPVPNLPGKSLDIASYWIEGVSTKSTHQKEAFLLLSYLQEKETLQKFYTETAKYRLFGEPYPRSDLADLLKGNALVYPFVQQAPIAASTYFVSDTYDTGGINDQMNAYLGNAVRSILESTSPQTAVETLDRGIIQVLSQYGQ